MELLQLKYFCDAAKEENFSKTAAKFCVPAAGVSQSIKRLERELGTELFERHANSISLSEDGRVFYSKVSEALLLIEEGKGALAESSGGGQIRILAAAVRRIVMETVEKYRRAYPNVKIHLSCDGREDPDDFDVVITGERLSPSFGTGESIVKERILLALNKSHPLAKEEKLTPERIKDESFVSMGKESNLSRVCEKICLSAGFEPKIAIRCDDPYYVRKCVELSLGIAIVPEQSWRGLFGEDVVLRPFGDYTRESFAYVNKKRSFGKNAKKFISLLKNGENAEY